MGSECVSSIAPSPTTPQAGLVASLRQITRHSSRPSGQGRINLRFPLRVLCALRGSTRSLPGHPSDPADEDRRVACRLIPLTLLMEPFHFLIRDLHVNRVQSSSLDHDVVGREDEVKGLGAQPHGLEPGVGQIKGLRRSVEMDSYRSMPQ